MILVTATKLRSHDGNVSDWLLKDSVVYTVWSFLVKQTNWDFVTAWLKNHGF